MLWVKGMGGKNESHSPDYSVYHSTDEGNKRVLIEGCRSLLCMYQVGCTCLCVMCDVWCVMCGVGVGGAARVL